MGSLVLNFPWWVGHVTFRKTPPLRGVSTAAVGTHYCLVNQRPVETFSSGISSKCSLVLRGWTGEQGLDLTAPEAAATSSWCDSPAIPSIMSRGEHEKGGNHKPP